MIAIASMLLALAVGTDYYVDPSKTTNAGNGTSWATAKAMFLKITGDGNPQYDGMNDLINDGTVDVGDTIYVKSVTPDDAGDKILIIDRNFYHPDSGPGGVLTITKYNVAGGIPRPIMHSCEMQSNSTPNQNGTGDYTSGVVIDGIRFDGDDTTSSGTILVHCAKGTQGFADHITIKDCEISHDWSADPEDLSRADWIAAAAGIKLQGYDLTAQDCTLKTVRTGITAGWGSVLIDGCELDGFSVDGIQLKGGGGVGSVENITVTDCYLHDAYWENSDAHEDFVQVMSNGDDGITNGLIIDRNTIIQTTRDHDTAGYPSIRGIICSDSKAQDSYFRNNLVYLNLPGGDAHAHGIVVDVEQNDDNANDNDSVFIQHNTVIGFDSSDNVGVTYISTTGDQGDSYVKGNLWCAYTHTDMNNMGVAESDSGNYIKAKTKLFVSAPTAADDYTWDLHMLCVLVENPAIDGAYDSPVTPPDTDLDGASRPVNITANCDQNGYGDSGSTYDYGCYEKQ
jgi:hypothetical protein